MTNHHHQNDPEKEIIAKLKKIKPKPPKEIQKIEEKINFKYLPKEEVILGWVTSSKEYYHKGHFWYLGVFLLLAIGVFFAIMSKSWTTTIVFVLLGSTLILQANENPDHTEIFITESGIYINKKIYEYKKIKEFWIIESAMTQKLVFLPKGFQVEKTIFIEDIDPTSIRLILKHFIKENPHKKENFVDHIIRFFKL